MSMMESATTTVMPPHIAALDRDHHGRPIPWFVHRDDAGVPDFRVARRDALADAILQSRCWVCGAHRGVHGSFVIGPMCAVNRISAEPPAHEDCAIYSARACPFLSTPSMGRRETGLPEDRTAPAGTMELRNPGVTLVWTSKTWEPFKIDSGVLFDIGDPDTTRWFAHGRYATREEVVASLDSGMPLLLADVEGEGQRAVDYIREQRERVTGLLPPVEGEWTP